MIPALIYFLLILFFIYRNNFFGLFKDEVIRAKKVVLLFAAKCLAIPVFYLIYQWKYGGIDKFDAGLYLKDSEILYHLAFYNSGDFLKLLFGMGDISPLSESYTQFVAKTANWDEGVSYRLLFNDNRSVIRIHTLIHFVSFHSYFVHALFSCFIGFTGIFWIYRSMADIFKGKEFLFLLTFCFLPNTWLFSGALLKEPLVLFNIGAVMLLINRLMKREDNAVRSFLFVLAIILLIVYLRPQITLPIALLYILFRCVQRFHVRFPSLIYLSVTWIGLVIAAWMFSVIKGKTVSSYLNAKQTEFVEVMNGGYFLKDDVKFVYLPHRPDWLKTDTAGGEYRYRIARGAQFHYRMDANQSIKHVCRQNADTLTRYKMIYELVPARSGFDADTLSGTLRDIKAISNAMAYGLFLPLKFDNLLSLVISAENLLLLFSFIVLILGIYARRNKLPLVFILTLTLFFIFLFGFTTPNTGAVVRYRSVVMPFLVCVLFYANRRTNKSETVSELP